MNGPEHRPARLVRNVTHTHTHKHTTEQGVPVCMDQSSGVPHACRLALTQPSGKAIHRLGPPGHTTEEKE